MADANNAGDNLSTNARDDVNLKPYRELTLEAVTLGVIQGIVLNLAFCYAALKLGFSLGGSTVAAIIGYALLRGVLRKGTMVENNINQTIASGINTAARESSSPCRPCFCSIRSGSRTAPVRWRLKLFRWRLPVSPERFWELS